MRSPTAGSGARALGQLKRAATLRGAIYNPFDGALPQSWLTPMNATATKSKPITPNKLRRLARHARERAASWRESAVVWMESARHWRDDPMLTRSVGADNAAAQMRMCVANARRCQHSAIQERGLATDLLAAAGLVEASRSLRQ